MNQCSTDTVHESIFQSDTMHESKSKSHTMHELMFNDTKAYA